MLTGFGDPIRDTVFQRLASSFNVDTSDFCNEKMLRDRAYNVIETVDPDKSSCRTLGTVVHRETHSEIQWFSLRLLSL